MRNCNQELTLNNNNKNMKKTSIVVVVTLITMFFEITYGLISGSMSLLADGIHMGTHTFAMLITLFAYIFTAKKSSNPNFTFSSGKISILGGYTNAIILGITAVFMISEAIHRFINPEKILFNQAILVAVLGLVVNIICALILSDSGHEHHHHGDEHHHHGHEHHHHEDHNLKAAYIHVITDALTSVLAILALIIGKIFNETWPDVVVAILGAIVILKWAYGLLISSGKLLVDYYPQSRDKKEIENLLSKTSSIIEDLHIWKISEKHKAIIISIKAGEKFELEDFKENAKKVCSCNHLTIELC